MLDLILVGATGFTGQRAARYLNNYAPENMKWGLSARNPEKLDMLSTELEVPRNHQFICDLTDAEAVQKMVSNTRLVITTAGPFSLYGHHLIAECSRQGVHYLDITGETDFIAEMEAEYASEAKQSGASIIPFCGFDSIPAEVAVHAMSSHFSEDDEVEFRSYYSISGGLNGGTLASMLNKFESGNQSNSGVLQNRKTEHIIKPEKSEFFGYDRTIERWSTPFVMSTVNSAVVYKSESLHRTLKTPRVGKIGYSEHTSLGHWYQPLSFLIQTLLLISLTSLLPFRWFRKILKKAGPAPGEGPSEREIEEGFIRLKAVAKTRDGSKKAAFRLSYDGDASNKATVFFLCESAFLLYQLKKNNSKSLPSGFITPSVAFGNQLLEHLKSRGMNAEGYSLC